MQKEIMVSITCIAYNHEQYIADAIEGFLIQKTNFPYEILIHDDASTDKTQEIIKKYESKYPDLIKPIYQTENQYSKGVKVGRFNRERAKGKYIAICEGDDYWIDPNKLQKQVDYMESHPECSLCVHSAYRVRPNKSKLTKHVRPNRGNKIYKADEVILGGGGLFATNSVLYPKIFSNNRPEFIESAPIGDYPLFIYLSFCGTVFYIDEFMSAYRVGVPGSWTTRMASSGIERRAVHIDKIADMLEKANSYSSYKYDSAIKEKIKINKMNILLAQGEAKENEFKEMYSTKSNIFKTKIFIKQYFPWVYKTIIGIKENFAR